MGFFISLFLGQNLAQVSWSIHKFEKWALVFLVLGTKEVQNDMADDEKLRGRFQRIVALLIIFFK